MWRFWWDVWEKVCNFAVQWKGSYREVKGKLVGVRS